MISESVDRDVSAKLMLPCHLVIYFSSCVVSSHLYQGQVLIFHACETISQHREESAKLMRPYHLAIYFSNCVVSNYLYQGQMLIFDACETISQYTNHSCSIKC